MSKITSIIFKVAIQGTIPDSDESDILHKPSWNGYSGKGLGIVGGQPGHSFGHLDDTLYYANKDEVKYDFEKKLSKQFYPSLLGKLEKCSRMRLRPNKYNLALYQDKYVNNIASRFNFFQKYSFKRRESPLTTMFVLTKKYCGGAEKWMKERKINV